jgi:DNA polymerase alpha-associated DNA helicase A
VCWIPIFKAKKLILAGDPMQLPPTVLSMGKGDKKSNKRDDKTAARATPNKQQSAISIDAEDSGSGDSDSVGSSDKERGGNNRDQKSAAVPKVKDKNKQRRRSLRPPRTLEVTLFDRLEKMHGPSIKMLNIQYRSDVPCTPLRPVTKEIIA